jgi:hypothetical protein
VGKAQGVLSSSRRSHCVSFGVRRERESVFHFQASVRETELSVGTGAISDLSLDPVALERNKRDS